MLRRARNQLDYLVGLHHIVAALAFVEGEPHGRGRPQSPFFARRAGAVVTEDGAPRCPGCQSRDLLPYKTLRPGEGSVSRYTQWRECGRKFVVVIE